MSEQGIAERLRAARERAMDAETIYALFGEAADELDRLRGELQNWIAFRQGDTSVIERLQAFLETLKSDAGTREEAIYDRIKERERQAFEAGWKARSTEVAETWAPSFPGSMADDYATYLADRKDH
jgi:hypothetical protein